MALYEANHQNQISEVDGIDVTLGFKLPGGLTLSQPVGAVYLQPETEWFLSLTNMTLGRWKLIVEVDGKALPAIIFGDHKEVLDFNPATRNRFKFVERTPQNDKYFGVSGATGKVIVACYKEIVPVAGWSSFGGYNSFGDSVKRGGRTTGGSQSDRQLSVAEKGTYSSIPVVFTFDLKVDPRFSSENHGHPHAVVCRHCHAVNAPGRDNCWQCGGTVNK